MAVNAVKKKDDKIQYFSYFGQKYSETCVREPSMRQTLNSEDWCEKVAVL